MSQTRRLGPKKYYKGLSNTRKLQRAKEIRHFGAYHWRDPRAYTGFATDKGVKTKSSSYTQQWNEMFPTVKSLKDRADVTGVPEDLLRESYNRGLAAWRTGHRPGATQQQWGYARVSSLLLLGKTAFTADADIVKRAKARSKKARAWFEKMSRHQ